MSLEKSAKLISEIIQKNGFEAFVIGGYCRDKFLGIPSKDIDITTNMLPKKIIEVFEGEGFKVVPTGLQFGTVTVIVNNVGFEVTTYRLDGRYSDLRHPDNVKFTTTLKEDCQRRDFTCNAIAENLVTGEIIDFFNGREDLKNGVIRIIGNAERFKEDPLRMLRACRFAAKFEFRISDETFAAMINMAEKISEVPMERVRDEMLKMMGCNGVDKGLRLMCSTGLMEAIIPEMYKTHSIYQPPEHHNFPVLEHCIQTCKVLPTDNPLLRFVGFIHDAGKDGISEKASVNPNEAWFPNHAIRGAEIFTNIARRLKMSNDDVEYGRFLIAEHMRQFHGYLKNDRRIRKWLANKVTERHVKDLPDLFSLWFADCVGTGRYEFEDGKRIEDLKMRINNVLATNPPLTVNSLKIDSNMLMELGIKPSPKLGEIQKELLRQVIDNPELNEKETLITLAKTLI